jgi:uncharacterized membrane protein
VLDAVKGTGGVVLKTSLDHTKEQALRDALAGVPPAASPAAAPVEAPGVAPPGVAGA